MILPNDMRRFGRKKYGSSQVYRKAALDLQPVICSERVGLGPINANQQFRFIEILLRLLEPQQPDRVHVCHALTGSLRGRIVDYEEVTPIWRCIRVAGGAVMSLCLV